MSKLIDKLKDLHLQATQERSHYYTKAVLEETIDAYEKLLEDNRRMAEALKVCAAIIRHDEKVLEFHDVKIISLVDQATAALTAHEQTMRELE